MLALPTPACFIVKSAELPIAEGQRSAAGLAAWLLSGFLLGIALVLGLGSAQCEERGGLPVKDRNVEVSREEATRQPRNERDQTIVGGWPLYRTQRGQAAFNDAMATLQATDGASPPLSAFKGCADLLCRLTLPKVQPDGWIPAGRYWVSPSEYVLIAHSPRTVEGRPPRRRTFREMEYLVFHEFHNSSRNTDPYDTISSHRGAVFVPFYMTKRGTDARGRRFVIVVQVAPWDVVSIHATNLGNAGPGIEVAKNAAEPLEPLQALAGILVATIIKSAAPHLEVVNHRGAEGLPMLEAYERRLSDLRRQTGLPTVALPFTAALPQRVATTAASLDDTILRPGAVPRAPLLVGPIKLARRPAVVPETEKVTTRRP